MLSQAGIEVVELYGRHFRAAMNRPEFIIYNGRGAEKITDICLPVLCRILEFKRDVASDYQV